MTPVEPPTLAEIREARQRLRGLVVETPVWRWGGDEVDGAMGPDTEVLLKLELFQRTGTG